MAKIYIVVVNESIDDLDFACKDNKKRDVLKAFRSIDTAIDFMCEVYSARIEDLKRTGSSVEYCYINNQGGCIFWKNPMEQLYGVTDYIIIERELAD